MPDKYEDIRDSLIRNGASAKDAARAATEIFNRQQGLDPSGRIGTLGDAVTRRRFGGQPYSATPRRGPQPKRYPTVGTGGGASKEKFD
jgi:hypothetical protein